jgi:hypothetical protein
VAAKCHRFILHICLASVVKVSVLTKVIAREGYGTEEFLLLVIFLHLTSRVSTSNLPCDILESHVLSVGEVFFIYATMVSSLG